MDSAAESATAAAAAADDQRDEEQMTVDSVEERVQILVSAEEVVEEVVMEEEEEMTAENEQEHPKEEEEADVPMEVVADDEITATSVTTKDITPTTSTTAANITESNPPPPPQEESSEEEGEEEDNNNNNNNNGIEEETSEKTAKEPLLRILELIPEPDPCAATTTTTTTTATATSESTSTPAANNITTATDAQNALSELFMLDQTPAKGSKKSVRPGWRRCCYCDKVGIKDTFYGRSKEFCSAKCRDAGRTGSFLEAIVSRHQSGDEDISKPLVLKPLDPLMKTWLHHMDAVKRKHIRSQAPSSSSSSSATAVTIEAPGKDELKNLNVPSTTTTSTSTTTSSTSFTSPATIDAANNELLFVDQTLALIGRNDRYRDVFFRNRYSLPFVTNKYVYQDRLNNPEAHAEKKLPLMGDVGDEQDNLVNISPLLDEFDFAPVDAFPHAPLAKAWTGLFAKEVVAEVCHEDQGVEYSWPCMVVSSKGYYMKAELLGKDRYYFLNPGMVNLFPLGYAAAHGKPYGVPFRNYAGPSLFLLLEELLQTHLTLTQDLFTAFHEDLPSASAYDPLVTYEVVDKSDPRQWLTAHPGGGFGEWRSFHYDLDCRRRYRWEHPRTGFVRASGWCQVVGQPLLAPRSYALNCLIEFFRDPATREEYARSMAVAPVDEPLEPPPGQGRGWAVGMKLEVLDPGDHAFRVGTVVAVLRYGYLQIKLDRDMKTLTFHFTSPHLYPATFCELNGVPLYEFPPTRMMAVEEQLFTWRGYPMRPGESFAPLGLFQLRRPVESRLQVRQVMECFNMRGHAIASMLIVLRIVGRLLMVDYVTCPSGIGFWVDADSPCLLPVGYTNMLQERDYTVRYDNVPVETIRKNIQAALERIDSGAVPNSLHEVIMPPADRRLEDTVQLDWSLVKAEREMRRRAGLAEAARAAPSAPSSAASQPPSSTGGVQKSNQKPYGSREARARMAEKLRKKPTPEELAAAKAKDGQPKLTYPITVPLAGYFHFELSGEPNGEVLFQTEKGEDPEPWRWGVSSEPFTQVCQANEELFEEPIVGIEELPVPLRSWTADHVAAFLARNFDLGKYAERLTWVDQTVTGLTLLKLLKCPEMLVELTDTIGDRLRFRLLLEKLRNSYCTLHQNSLAK